MYVASRHDPRMGLAIFMILLNHSADPNAQGGKYEMAPQAVLSTDAYRISRCC